MDLNLGGKIAIVTGGAQGIGQAISELLIAEGATVVLADVKDEGGIANAGRLGERASYVHCDISDLSQVQSLINGTVEKFGRLDIMVNNAGINSGKPEERVTIDQFSLDLWKKIIDVDLNGTFYCCRTAAEKMVTQGSGTIINIASVAGVVALRLQVPFVAAKAGIIKMTEAMACELGPKGIRVNTVSPGSTLVEGTKSMFYSDKAKADHFCSFIPQRRPGETHEIADAVAFLASDRAAYINGHNIIVDGGWVCGFNRDF